MLSSFIIPSYIIKLVHFYCNTLSILMQYVNFSLCYRFNKKEDMGFNINMKKMFGKRLRELRTAKMLTQETVAELIEIKPENYSRIENGLSFPKPENIVKLSKVLNVEIAELFQFSHLNDYDEIINTIIQKLKTDKDAAVITYKFLKSLGKI